MTAFVDTCYYLAVVNPRDPLHPAAEALGRQLDDEFLTTEYVLLEVANSLSRPVDRPVFVRLMDQLAADEGTIRDWTVSASAAGQPVLRRTTVHGLNHSGLIR